MITKTEMQNILNQVNVKFDDLNKRIEQLEAEVKKTKTTRTTKKVEEKT